MTSAVAEYGSVERNQEVTSREAQAEQNGKPLSDDAIVVKIDDAPRPFRQHRGHVRTGSSVEDHVSLDVV